MSLKRQLLDAVKASTPGFDETKHSFYIEFEGGGDSFGSFTDFDTNVEGVESNFDPGDHYELIMEIMDKSGVDYTFINYGSNCKMIYEGGVLSISTECGLEFEDSDYYNEWQDEFDDEDEARDAYYDDMQYSEDYAEFED